MGIPRVRSRGIRLVSLCGIGVPPMLHGRDAHATLAPAQHAIALASIARGVTVDWLHSGGSLRQVFQVRQILVPARSPLVSLQVLNVVSVEQFQELFEVLW